MPQPQQRTPPLSSNAHECDPPALTTLCCGGLPHPMNSSGRRSARVHRTELHPARENNSMRLVWSVHSISLRNL
eukprot:3677917-Amphidinium_carterae.2